MIASTGLQQLTRLHDANSAPQQQQQHQLHRARLLPTKQSALQSGQVKAPGDHMIATSQQSGLPLASSFSFNSYQDILCNAATFQSSRSPAAATLNEGGGGGGGASRSHSQSTFSAPDVKRSLTVANLNAQPRPAYRAQSGGGWSTFANGAKFRVHSRHHSISRLNELARPPEQTNGAVGPDRCATTATTNRCGSKARLTLVAQSTPEEPQAERDSIEWRRTAHKVGSLHQEQQQVSHSDNNLAGQIINLQTKLDTNNQQQQQQQQQQVFVQFASNNKHQPKAITNKSSIMSSGTMQSIQSLSMQLNQAKARSNQSGLNDDGSGLEEPSSLQSSAQSNTSSAGKLGKLMGKKATRVKELVLQNLGKADRTADELFEMYEQNFYKQQAQALRLQKEFKNYVICMKGIHEAGKSLNNCIQQSTGDYQSARHDLVCENLSQLEHLNDDLLDKLRGQVLVNLTEYLSQFHELREKIAKRKRKLIDFDSSRRIYELQLVAVNKKRLQLQRAQHQPPGSSNQTGGARSALRSAFMFAGGASAGGGGRQTNDSLQTATSQLVDEARLLKLREQYNYCKVMYETINSELHEELPMVYEKKMKHLLMSLQNYFSFEAQFHSNASKLFATAGDVIDELPMSVLQAAAHLHSRHQMIRRNSSSLSLTAAAVGTQATDSKVPSAEIDGYNDNNNKQISAGSSGMGSSRGDSSLDSSSSHDEGASLTTDSPAENNQHHHRRSPTDDANQDQAQLDAAGQEEVGGSLQACHLHDGPRLVECPTGRDQHNVDGKQTVTGEAHSSPSVIAVDSCTSEQNQFEQTVGGAINTEVQLDSSSQSKNPEQQVATELDKQDNAVAHDDVNDGVAKKEDVFLYKVKTSYKYLAEDVDELCFEADEILQVVEYEPAHEQEDGWLMGVREVNGQRGLFPANFTQPI